MLSEEGLRHRPVLAREVLDALALPRGGVAWDLTVGDGAHAALLLEAMGTGGRLMGMDRDPKAIEAAGAALSAYGDRVRLVRGPFSGVGSAGFLPPDGVLMDLGVSTRQILDPRRGFSFSSDGPLDMRMGPEGPSAAEVVNSASEGDLERILRELGEERWAGRIARALARNRPILTTGRLAEIVAGAVPGRGRRHPATRVFQALRIHVNDELGELERGLEAVLALLPAGSRLAVISFHSLEDRIVKRVLRARSAEPGWRLLPRKAVKAGREEVLSNPRARSARLRTILREAA